MSVLNKTLKGLEQRQSTKTNESEREQTVVVKPVFDIADKLHKFALPSLILVAVLLTGYVVYKQDVFSSDNNHAGEKQANVSSEPNIEEVRDKHIDEANSEIAQRTLTEQVSEETKSLAFMEGKPLKPSTTVTNLTAQEQPLPAKQIKPKLSQNLTPSTQRQNKSSPPPELSMKEIAQVSASQKAQEYFQAGKKAFTFGMVSEAIAELQQCIGVLPEHIECRSLLAAAYYGRKDITKASSVLEQGLGLRPDSIEWRTLLAKVYADNKQYHEVLSVLPQQFENQGGSDFWILKGLAAQQLAQHEVALRSFKKLTLSEPQHGKWWMAMGRSAEQLKQWQNAIQYYTTATQIGNLSPSSQRYAVERLQFLRGQLNAS